MLSHPGLDTASRKRPEPSEVDTVFRGRVPAARPGRPPAPRLSLLKVRLKLSGKFSMDLRIPPLKITVMLEPNPLKSRILVRRLAARLKQRRGATLRFWKIKVLDNKDNYKFNNLSLSLSLSIYISL